ncbi:Mediator of RNA polymerase II transcription subunit 18 [Blyttiomyces sp. JEL0837]|nr:Mediator of RNA polymerase II transcription subunit 18 [Blyttiomyces sp. JEL0837]
MMTERVGGHYECSVQGLIPNDQVHKLIERIIGLCGFISFDGQMNVLEHEIVYTIGESPSVWSKTDTMLRIKASAIQHDGTFIRLKQRAWSLNYLGPIEPPKSGILTSVRAVYNCAISGDIFKFVSLMGYKQEFEFVRKGYQFNFGTLIISITQIYTLRELNKVSCMEILQKLGANWLVEITSERTSQEMVSKTSEDIARFANDLKGLVELGIVEIR